MVEVHVSSDHQGFPKKRAVLVSTAILLPRHQRRARMLSEAGLDVHVYAFQRDWYTENIFSSDISVTNLGRMRDGNYFKRLPLLWRAAKRIRKMEGSNKNPPEIRYAFGLDSALIALLAFPRSTVPLIYEIGDVRNPNPKDSLINRLIYAQEKKILKEISRLVVTAPAFVSDYYEKMHPGVQKKTVLIENKLPAGYDNLVQRPSCFQLHEPIRIGFIGNLRYADSFRPMLKSVSNWTGEYELHVFGDGPLRTDVEMYARTSENVFYHGPFRNPDDLSEIYQSIDISYVVYDNRNGNVRMALPNKLYESIYFGVPMIVASETELAKRVESLGIGFVIDPRRENFIEDLLNSISTKDITTAAKKALELPTNLAIQDDRAVAYKLTEGVF